MATANQIREVVRAQPFRPFIIHLADGRTFDVPHPEFVAVAGGRELLFIADDDGIHQFDMRKVAEIETPPPAPRAPLPRTEQGPQPEI